MPRVPSAAAAHIGKRIAEARLHASLTQDQLAVRTEIDSSNIRGYENGRAMPSIHTLLRISIALGVEPAVLLDGLTLEHFDGGVRTRKAG